MRLAIWTIAIMIIAGVIAMMTNIPGFIVGVVVGTVGFGIMLVFDKKSID